MEAERQQENWNELTKDITMGLVEEHFLESIDPEPSFCEYLDRLCEQTGKKRWQVIANSGIDRTYGYQLFNGTRKPSRDKAIQLAIGFELNVDQTQELYARGKKTRWSREKARRCGVFCWRRDGRARIRKTAGNGTNWKRGTVLNVSASATAKSTAGVNTRGILTCRSRKRQFICQPDQHDWIDVVCRKWRTPSSR